MDTKQPFGLPEGTVRAALVGILTLTACWLWVTKGAVPPQLETILEWGLAGYGFIRTAAGVLAKFSVVPNPTGPSAPPAPPVAP